MDGATIFGYQVANPEEYGVVDISENGKALNLEEKPKAPNSPLAVPGIYFYDEDAPALAKSLNPSMRGELEITDLNRTYLDANKLYVEILGRGTAWLDTGTHESLMDAARFVEVIEKRQGLKIGCIEEIAFRNNWITTDDLDNLIKQLGNSEYRMYLDNIKNLIS